MTTHRIELWNQGWSSDIWIIEVPNNICARGVNAVYNYMSTLRYPPIHFMIAPDSKLLIESIQKLYKVSP